ncbi:MAG: heavy metal translocating P-type ATPase [Eubacteriales bacterium]
MKFNVVTHQAGRIRLRMGKHHFTKEQGYALSALLSSIEGVTEATTCHHNGSVLVLFTSPTVPDLVCERVSSLSICDLNIPLPEDFQVQIQEDQFKTDIMGLVATHYLIRWFCPLPLRNLRTYLKSIPLIKAGLIALTEMRTSVELLDATAITASLYQKDFTTASSTIFLLKLSDLLLEYSNLRAKNQLAKSLVIKTTDVWLITPEGEVSLPISNLQVGDTIRVRKGSCIPVDGTVISGEGMVNESTMTGEPLPVHKHNDSTVFAGTILEEGELDLTVRTLGGNTRIAGILQMIEEGEELKAHIQGKAERLADQIVPISFGLSLLTLAISRNLPRALSVLMVDFSCAIKLTTPIAVISALREGAQKKIVVKGGKYLELLSQVDTVVFDKTGTLTNATPKISKILPISPDYSEEEVLKIAACLEEHFPHSVAASIVAEAEERGIPHPETHEKVEYIVAHGIATSFNGVRSLIGSRHFVFEDEQIPYPSEKDQWLSAEIGSDSAVYLAVNGALVGVICINDPPRAEAKEAIAQLRANGIQSIVMITGDGESTAKEISNQLGIDRYFASVLPDEKANLIQGMKDEGKLVMMVGDGLNDAPALSCANVSVTLQGSSDLAREVSDIAILSHNLLDILEARKLATGMMEKISNHYGFILGFNSLLIGLGIFGITTAAQNAWMHNISTVSLAAYATRPILPERSDTDETA